MYVKTAFRFIDDRGYEMKEPDVIHHLYLYTRVASHNYGQGDHMVAKIEFDNGGVMELHYPTVTFETDYIAVRGQHVALTSLKPPEGAKGVPLVYTMQHWAFKINLTRDEIDVYAKYMKKRFPDWKEDWRLA